MKWKRAGRSIKGLKFPQYIAGVTFLRASANARKRGGRSVTIGENRHSAERGGCTWASSMDGCCCCCRCCCRIDCTHEWSGMTTESGWMAPCFENGNFLYFPRHQHTCTYFCWHYVKWWIISGHRRVTTRWRCVRGGGEKISEGGWVKLDFLPSTSYSSIAAADKRFQPRKDASMIWLNGRIFLFCRNTNIKTHIKASDGGRKKGGEKDKRKGRSLMCSTFLTCERWGDCRAVDKTECFSIERTCFRFDLMFPDQEKNWCHLSCIGVISTI